MIDMINSMSNAITTVDNEMIEYSTEPYYSKPLRSTLKLTAITLKYFFKYNKIYNWKRPNGSMLLARRTAWLVLDPIGFSDYLKAVEKENNNHE